MATSGITGFSPAAALQALGNGPQGQGIGGFSTAAALAALGIVPSTLGSPPPPAYTIAGQGTSPAPQGGTPMFGPHVTAPVIPVTARSGPGLIGDRILRSNPQQGAFLATTSPSNYGGTMTGIAPEGGVQQTGGGGAPGAITNNGGMFSKGGQPTGSLFENAAKLGIDPNAGKGTPFGQNPYVPPGAGAGGLLGVDGSAGAQTPFTQQTQNGGGAAAGTLPPTGAQSNLNAGTGTDNWLSQGVAQMNGNGQQASYSTSNDVGSPEWYRALEASRQGTTYTPLPVTAQTQGGPMTPAQLQAAQQAYSALYNAIPEAQRQPTQAPDTGQPGSPAWWAAVNAARGG